MPVFPEISKSYKIEKQKIINKFFHEFLNPKAFNGQFLVAKNGEIIYFRSQGSADFSKNYEMKSTTPIHVASVSKVATALAVLRLVDQNKIILDKDVRYYLSMFPYRGITVRMLLNHRSGVPYYGYFTFKKWKLGKTLYNKDILYLLKKYKFPLNFPPDTKFAYCNTNYSLLALIIEKVTGNKFPRAMKELIFEPLKMNNSFILAGKWHYKKVSQSYNSRHVLQEFNYLDAVYGDKNLYTTALDLLKMDKATYSSNFLSDSLRKQMFKGYSYEQPGKSNYGLGIRMREMPQKDTYFFHTGWWHGNTACYATLRADTVCVIALSNVYTRNVYSINRLTEYFGNYPFDFSQVE
jgi:CubicO group peptidase (beta-lactamase class C family)